MKIDSSTAQDVSLIKITATNWASLVDDLLAIEQDSFPPSLQDSTEALRRIAESGTGIILGAMAGGQRLVGYVAGDELEAFHEVPGTISDPHYGHHDTCYVESWAVTRTWQGRGVGTLLLEECLRGARSMGYCRATAHMERGRAQALRPNVTVLNTFPDWYETGRTFEYTEFSLEGLR